MVEQKVKSVISGGNSMLEVTLSDSNSSESWCYSPDPVVILAGMVVVSLSSGKENVLNCLFANVHCREQQIHSLRKHEDGEDTFIPKGAMRSG